VGDPQQWRVEFFNIRFEPQGVKPATNDVSPNQYAASEAGRMIAGHRPDPAE